MTDAGESWRTPAGEALARSCVAAASEGRPTLLRARRAGAAARLREHAEDCACDFVALDVSAAASPISSVAAAAGFGDRMAGTGALLNLISGAALRDAILFADVAAVDPAPWISFAGVFATARRTYGDRAAGLILMAREPLRAPAGCEARSDDGIVDVIDAMAAIRNWSGWEMTQFNEVAMASAVEVSRGDLDLLRELTDAGVDVAFDPVSWLKDKPAPKASGLLPWRARDEEDPIWLAHFDLAHLRRRLWRGQLTVLFPWIETVRIDYLRGRRSFPAERSESLEYTPLISALRTSGAGRGQIAALTELRDARNELAHGRSLARDQVVRLAYAHGELANY